MSGFFVTIVAEELNEHRTCNRATTTRNRILFITLNCKVYLSSISIAEFQFGVYNSSNIGKNRISLTEFLAPFELIYFDDNDAEQFGIIRAQLKKAGKIIGPYDMLIAAQAMAKKLVLVTNNTKEFKRVKG